MRAVRSLSAGVNSPDLRRRLYDPSGTIRYRKRLRSAGSAKTRAAVFCRSGQRSSVLRRKPSGARFSSVATPSWPALIRIGTSQRRRRRTARAARRTGLEPPGSQQGRRRTRKGFNKGGAIRRGGFGAGEWPEPARRGERKSGSAEQSARNRTAVSCPSPELRRAVTSRMGSRVVQGA